MAVAVIWEWWSIASLWMLLCDPYSAERIWFWGGIELMNSWPTFLMDNVWLFSYSWIQISLGWIGGFSLQLPPLSAFSGGAQEFWEVLGPPLCLRGLSDFGPFFLQLGLALAVLVLEAELTHCGGVKCVLPQSSWSFPQFGFGCKDLMNSCGAVRVVSWDSRRANTRLVLQEEGSTLWRLTLERFVLPAPLCPPQVTVLGSDSAFTSHNPWNFFALWCCHFFRFLDTRGQERTRF